MIRNLLIDGLKRRQVEELVVIPDPQPEPVPVLKVVPKVETKPEAETPDLDYENMTLDEAVAALEEGVGRFRA